MCGGRAGSRREDYAEFRRRVEEFLGSFKMPRGCEDQLGLGSTWQSVRRSAGSVETELLNGEVVRLGELVGINTPHNRLVTDLAEQMVRDGSQPGRYAEEEILGMISGLS